MFVPISIWLLPLGTVVIIVTCTLFSSHYWSNVILQSHIMCFSHDMVFMVLYSTNLSLLSRVLWWTNKSMISHIAKLKIYVILIGFNNDMSSELFYVSLVTFSKYLFFLNNDMTPLMSKWIEYERSCSPFRSKISKMRVKFLVKSNNPLFYLVLVEL